MERAIRTTSGFCCYTPPLIASSCPMKQQIQSCRPNTQTSSPSGTLIRTFTSTTIRAKDQNAPQQSEDEQRRKVQKLQRNIDRAMMLNSLASQQAMSKLMHKLQSQPTSSQTHQARVDRVHAEMEFVHAESNHMSTLGEMVRQISPFATTLKFSWTWEDAARVLKSERAIKEAYLASRKMLRVSFESAIPTVFAPWYVIW